MAKEGGKVNLDKVLMIADGDKVTIGKPYVDGAKVTATVRNNGRGKKITVFKYKPKVRYRRKKGHHQLNTSLNIDRILPTGVEEPKPAKKSAPMKTVRTAKPAAKAAPKTAPKAVKPAAKAPSKATAKASKPAAKAVKPAPKAAKLVKRTPRKKTEEKTDGA